MRIELGPPLLGSTPPVARTGAPVTGSGAPVWRIYADVGEFYGNAYPTLLGSITRRGAITLATPFGKNATRGLLGEQRHTVQVFMDDARRVLVTRGDVRHRAVERSLEDPNAQRAYAAKKHAIDLATQRSLFRGSPWSLPGVGVLRPYASEIADAWDVALDAFLEAGLPLQATFARRYAQYWRDEDAYARASGRQR